MSTTVGFYLLKRLKEIGVDHVFGVPGDFVLGFFDQLLESDVHYVGTCNELNAAYAADGYARIKGVGCCATTYSVGELSALNGVAGAFAENIPVIAITGAPATVHYEKSTILHHTLGDYKIPQEIYEKVTVASTLLNNPKTAPEEIDRVLYACLEHKKPVYISLPADIVMEPCAAPKPFIFPAKKTSDPAQLKEALEEAVALLEASKMPILIADAELVSYRLQKTFAQLLTHTNYPYATMMLGKTVLDEDHPHFIGQYQGLRSRDYVKNRVEHADAVVLLGPVLSDLNTGGFSVAFEPNKTISANIFSLRIKHHLYDRVHLEDFMLGLATKLKKRNPADLNIKAASEGCTHRRTASFHPEPKKKITLARFFDRMSSFIEEHAIVLAETGTSLFSASETLMPKKTTFIGQTFYGSIGYTVGATLGAAVADPKRRTILFIGDGSFQVTCQDLSTMMREKVKPIVFLINNDGYTIERVITDNTYNDIASWKYHQLPQVFGDGLGIDVHTEEELEEALKKAKMCDRLCLIEIHTGKMDCSPALKTAGEAMARANRLI